MQSPNSFERLAVYVVAHADDWQLFMQPNALHDLAGIFCKPVFIIVTAGDAGMGEKYWKAREEGCASSIRFLLSSMADITESSSSQKILQHKICCWKINQACMYFLRLPDGNIDGEGFAPNNYQSLQNLLLGKNDMLQTVDGNNRYESWTDISETVKQIIQLERSAIEQVNVHYQNPDAIANPQDHADHYAVGRLVDQLSFDAKTTRYLYNGYSLGKTDNQLSPSHVFWKTAMFAAYEKAVYDQCGYSTLKETHDTYRRWCLAAQEYVKKNVLTG